MRHKKKISDKNNLGIAIIFIILVLVLIIISGIFKIVSLVAQSRFDGKHRFTIGLSNKKSNISVVSFAPDNLSVSYLLINPDLMDGKGDLETKNIKVKELNIIKNLSIPVDAFIEFSSNDFGFLKPKDDKKSIDFKMQDIILNYKNIKTDLTVVDLLRLWVFYKTVPSHSVSGKDFTSGKNGFIISKVSSSLFNDYTVSQEKISIEIINGTEILGLGNRLAGLITNMGGNVVAVSTSDKPIEKSEISYFGEKTYTLERLVKILSFKTIVSDKQEISDITVKLGKDTVPFLMF